ncbi:MAG TPA: sigma-54 dependent transcriptional regulator [Candidatus Limnocylindrales bacterium]|nr:sigma-54 dependent transcriptional regulator [Candidatus Limnocylindrales bacterium]
MTLDPPKIIPRPKILVVDDEKNMCRAISSALNKIGGIVEVCYTGPCAIEKVRSNEYDVVLLDYKMPGMDGIEVLKVIRDLSPELIVIMMTAYGTVESAVQAMKIGAYDYVLKPFEAEEIRLYVNRALEYRWLLQENRNLRQQVEEKYHLENMVGISPQMEKIYEMVHKVANSTATVLIQGESGTGKELIARALHAYSERKGRPFVGVNCSAIPANLLESEFFGYEKGAFTGAHHQKKGFFEAAHTGTLFLDEIGEMSPSLQSKLLRVLQEKEIIRIGGTQVIPIDVRVIAATNVDLAELVKKGQFREDLYYRLNVINMVIPPLRERKEDIPLLVKHFLNKLDPQQRIRKISPDVLEALKAYSWPGNVRELENVIERMVLLSEGPVLEIKDLPAPLREVPKPPPLSTSGILNYKEAKERFEREFIIHALQRNKGNVTNAALETGIYRQNFYDKLNKYGINPEDFK